jgi:DNA-directed RNA polymerase I, II, and III subunit RPABC2
MDFDNEPENIEEYFSSNDEEEEYAESDADNSETEEKKPEPIKIGGASSDEEEEGDDDVEVDLEDDEDESIENESEEDTPKEKKVKPTQLQIVNSEDENEDDEEDDDEEEYLQKFNKDINNNYILNVHPECKIHNYDEISALSRVVYNSDGIIDDPLHRTIPILTKYEHARVLGQRAKQINSGSKPFVKVPENIIDGYLIAELELSQKRIPFIIRRPFPGGGSEYWNLKDLELV